MAVAKAKVDKAESQFRSKIAELGGVVIGEYRGTCVPVMCMCSNGHMCSPCPSNIRSGQGMCQQCTADLKYLYIVVGPRAAKIGVASNSTRDAKHRRTEHFNRTELWLDLGHDLATYVEKVVKRKFPMKFLSKKELRDGYTETFDAKLVSCVTKYVYDMIRMQNPTHPALDK